MGSSERGIYIYLCYLFSLTAKGKSEVEGWSVVFVGRALWRTSAPYEKCTALVRCVYTTSACGRRACVKKRREGGNTYVVFVLFS